MESIDVCILVGGLTPSPPSTLCDCILYWRPALLATDDKFIIGCRSLSFSYSLSLPFSHILILYLLYSVIFANHSVSFSNSLFFPPLPKNPRILIANFSPSFFNSSRIFAEFSSPTPPPLPLPKSFADSKTRIPCETASRFVFNHIIGFWFVFQAVWKDLYPNLLVPVESVGRKRGGGGGGGDLDTFFMI